MARGDRPAWMARGDRPGCQLAGEATWLEASGTSKPPDWKPRRSLGSHLVGRLGEASVRVTPESRPNHARVTCDFPVFLLFLAYCGNPRPPRNCGARIGGPNVVPIFACSKFPMPPPILVSLLAYAGLPDPLAGAVLTVQARHRAARLSLRPLSRLI